MKTLQTYLNALSTSEQIEFATRCNTTIGYLRSAISRDVEFRSALCIDLARESNGAVRCEDLVPNADWNYLRTQRSNHE